MEVTKKIPSLRFPGFEGAWEEKKLGEVVQNKIKGNTPDYENPKNLLLNNDFMENQAIPIYVGNEIDVKANDLLILWDGSQAGKVYTGFEGVLGSTFTAINFGSDASHLFIYNALSHNLSTIQRVWREGSGIPHVAKDFIKNYKIQLPSLPEQQKIADCLTAMDDTIEAQQQKVEQLQAYKKGLLQQLFSQTLRFPGFEGEWEEKKLGEVLLETTVKTKVNNQYDVISSTNDGLFLQRDYFSHEVASKNNVGYKILKLNQVVLSPQNLWLGNINLNNKFEIGMVSPSYKIFKVGREFDENFIGYLIRTKKMFFEYKMASEQGASIVRRNLNMDLFRGILIKSPTLPEQQKIAECLSTLDEVIELEQQKLEKLQVYKKGLLQQLFV